MVPVLAALFILICRELPSERRRILDGTSYLFFLSTGNGEEPRVGLTRSPEAGTRAAVLAELAEALRRHVEAPEGDRTRTEAEILRRAREVLATRAP